MFFYLSSVVSKPKEQLSKANEPERGHMNN